MKSYIRVSKNNSTFVRFINKGQDKLIPNSTLDETREFVSVNL